VKAKLKCSVLVHPMHRRPEQLNEMSKIQDTMQKLQRSVATDPHSRLTYVEASLLQYAHELVVQGTTIYEPSVVAESLKIHCPPAADSGVASWIILWKPSGRTTSI
jgi:hypothetical protein